MMFGSFGKCHIARWNHVFNYFTGKFSSSIFLPRVISFQFRKDITAKNQNGEFLCKEPLVKTWHTLHSLAWAGKNISTKSLHVNQCDASISALCLYLRLRRPGLNAQHEHKHKHKRTERYAFSCACAYTCDVLRRTCKPRCGNRSYVHQSNLAPKGSRVIAPKFYACAWHVILVNEISMLLWMYACVTYG